MNIPLVPQQNNPQTQTPSASTPDTQFHWGGLLHPFSAVADYTAPTPTPQAPQNQINYPQLLKGQGEAETANVQGNRYTSSQYSGKPNLGMANGMYRVTDGELRDHSKRFLGQTITPQQFLASPQTQDRYMDAKNHWLGNQNLTPEQIMAIHNNGLPTKDNKGIEYDFSPQKLQHVVDTVNSRHPNYLSTGMNIYNQSRTLSSLTNH